MEILTITDMAKTLTKLLQSKGYKLKVNENSYLVFESKEHYKKIKKLERLLFYLVNDVINGINKEEYQEYESESESGNEELELFNIKLSFSFIESYVEKIPLTEVNVFEFEKNELLHHPLEIKFPTLVCFFMTLHDKEEGYSNYKLFCKKIKSKKLERSFRDLRKIICEVISLK